jgi:hypothetical protein
LVVFPAYNFSFPALESEHYFLERVVQALLHLRVVSPFLSIRQSNQRPAFFTVPKGAVVETTDDLDQAGLVPIEVGDQLLLAFRRDLRERAELVKRPTLVRAASVSAVT